MMRKSGIARRKSGIARRKSGIARTIGFIVGIVSIGDRTGRRPRIAWIGGIWIMIWIFPVGKIKVNLSMNW